MKGFKTPFQLFIITDQDRERFKIIGAVNCMCPVSEIRLDFEYTAERGDAPEKKTPFRVSR